MKLLIAVLGFVFATPTRPPGFPSGGCDQIKQWCNLDVRDGIYENMEECLDDWDYGCFVTRPPGFRSALTCDQIKQGCYWDVADGIYENMEECLADSETGC